MKKKSKKWIEREKLNSWRLAVLERDNYTCQICKVKPLKINVHHIIPRQFKETKYDINNGICLCFQHHKVGKYSPHLNSLYFYIWLKENKKEQFEYLIKKIKEKEIN